MLPFSQSVLDYIDRLDPEADCELLSSELPWLREAALRTLVISTTLLKVLCGIFVPAHIALPHSLGHVYLSYSSSGTCLSCS